MKIVLLGNPTPTVSNPLRLGEELSMIDLISGGRLVPGWVRGAGSEQLANNSNPAYNREYFDEAHDLILKSWTTPGPFRWKGKHFHFRFVNPWVLPLQKPHPPIWIPGLVSPETVVWAARHRYPYVALATYLQPTTELWNMYTAAAAQEGYQAGPENFGYMQPIFVASNQAKAEEMGKRFLFRGGFSNFARPEWMFPSGYNSKEATRRLARQFANPNQPGKTIMAADSNGSTEAVDIQAAKKALYADYDQWQKNYQMIAGTPKNVIPKLRKVLEVLRPGIFSFWLDGPIPSADRISCLKLPAEKVVPALREISRELELVDPFQRKPGSRSLPASGRPEMVVRPEALAALSA